LTLNALGGDVGSVNSLNSGRKLASIATCSRIKAFPVVYRIINGKFIGGKVFATQTVELQASGTERTDSFGELQVLLHQSHVSTWQGNEFGLR